MSAALLEPRLPQTGETIGGKYTLLRVIGEGGMGIVFEAQHQRIRQRVAIKVLHPSMASEREVLERFEVEARASAILRSRHVARVMDVETTADGLPYMVMEMLEGHDLEAERVARGPCLTGRRSITSSRPAAASPKPTPQGSSTAISSRAISSSPGPTRGSS